MLKTKPWLLKTYALLAVLESAVAFYYLASIPSGAENTIFGGYSLSRLLLLACAAIPFSVFGVIFIAISVSSSRLNQLILSVDNLLGVKWKRLFIVVFSYFLVFFSVFLLLTPPDRFGDFAAISERLAPLVYLGGVLGAQTLLGQFFWREQKVYFQNLHEWKSILTIAGVLLAFIAILAVWISWSGVGIKPESSGWFAPGSPILLQQVLFAWVISLVLITFEKRLEKIKNLDLFIGLGLWLVAGLVWWMEPMQRWSYFTPKPVAPNFEYYPYSDAAVYDGFSQNMLIGESRLVGVTNRPLYSIFLFFLHLIGGQDFKNIIFLQVFVFAVMPLFVYLLVTKLGGRPAGMVAGLVVLFRERNSIALTNVIEVSHLKLLMSDVPTMVLMSAFIYFFILWLQNRDGRMYLGLLAGGFFGLTVLIRSQSQLLLPIVFLAILLTGRFKWRVFIQRIMVFLLAFLVIIAPWIWRNYRVSGMAVVEYQNFYTKIIASGYSSSPGDVELLPNESREEYDKRMTKLIADFIVDNPIEVARFYSSYFLHNEISAVASLPMSLHFFDVYDYVEEMGYWKTPLGSLPRTTLPVFFFTLSLIVLGIGAAFYRYRWTGLVPLFFHLVYSFSVVPVRMSGWRYILPVDWIVFLYFSIGLVQLTVMLRELFLEKIKDVPAFQENQADFVSWKGFGFVLTICVLIGLSFPLMEWSMPVSYPPLSDNQLIETYAADGLPLDSGGRVTASALKIFLETEPAATVRHGRALYPSYYEQGDFWGESSPSLLEASRFDRLQFSLIGPGPAFIFIPTQNVPQYFPHASDVFIVGCKQDGFIRALMIKVNEHVVISSPWNGLTCSETE